MKFRYKFGIKFKITAAFSVVFVCLSLFFNIYCYHQIRILLIEDNNKYLLDRAYRFLGKIEVSPVIIPLPGDSTMIRVLYRTQNRHRTVFESPGIIKRIATPLKNGVSDTLNMRVTYVSSSSEDNPAELILVTDGSQLNKNLKYLLVLLFACSLVCVVIAGLVSYILAFYLLRPVQKIINAANVINANQLNDLIPVENTDDELQELSETINRMLLRIEASAQQQQNFFASASHELKTPLAILRAELELGLKKIDISPEFAQLLKSQLEEINRLQLVVQEFLMISQLKSGFLAIHPENVDIGKLILKAFNQLQSLLSAKSLEPVIHFNEEIDNFIIRVDRDKVWVVLLNLIENAIKYSPHQATINFNMSRSDDLSILKINIINIIIPESIDTQLLKNAFHRSEVILPGNGMGLWLSDQLISMLNGQLLLSSSGHKFTVELLLLC